MPYTITITGGFHATHALRLYDGQTEKAHGHDWRVTVTAAAGRLDRIDVVMDFHLLERKMAAILSELKGRDLGKLPPFAGGKGSAAINPSAERVAEWIAGKLGAQLPRRVKLAAVAVEEEPGCIATYRPGAARGRAKRGG
jgi:6-pyruvoyltetrahydropterin/6-carboxytetrahydropterin synthase